MTGVLDRLLDRTGRDDDAIACAKLQAMRRLVLMTLAFEGWVALRYVPYSESPGLHAAIATALGLCALLGWMERFALPALFGAILLEVVTVASAFPYNGNHQFLAIALLALIALAYPAIHRESRPDPRDAGAAVAAMRWIVLAGLVWSGVMKLVYGYWLGGEFLSYRIALDPGFARVFAAIVPDAEMARLVTLENRIGAGPFRAEAPLLVAVSNLTWIAEIVLPIGLLLPRTRTLAMLALLALMVAIQAGARELFFAGLMFGGLLLSARRDLVGRLIPVAGISYAIGLVWPWLSRAADSGASS